MLQCISLAVHWAIAWFWWQAWQNEIVWSASCTRVIAERSQSEKMFHKAFMCLHTFIAYSAHMHACIISISHIVYMYVCACILLVASDSCHYIFLARERPKNFPPLPRWFPLQPCFHVNVNEEIPDSEKWKVYSLIALLFG